MVKIASGWLKPNGEFIEVPYMAHLSWADDEVRKLENLSVRDIYMLKAPDDTLRVKYKYIQISNGYAFHIPLGEAFGGHGFGKLSTKQADWILMNLDRLDKDTKRGINMGCFPPLEEVSLG